MNHDFIENEWFTKEEYISGLKRLRKAVEKRDKEPSIIFHKRWGGPLHQEEFPEKLDEAISKFSIYEIEERDGTLLQNTREVLKENPSLGEFRLPKQFQGREKEIFGNTFTIEGASKYVK